MSLIEELTAASLHAAYLRGRADERAESTPSVDASGSRRFSSPSSVIDALQAACGESVIIKGSGMIDSRRALAPVRFAACVLLREDCHLSYSRIAKLLGYYDHTTVMNAVRRAPHIPECVNLIALCRQSESAA